MSRKSVTIAKRREALGLSQPELAAKVGRGCNQQTISRLEAGKTTTSKHLDAILETLDELEARSSGRPSELNVERSVDDIRAVLEVVLRTLSNSDKAAEWAAQAVLQELLEPREPPYGLTRPQHLRAEVARILRELSGLKLEPDGLAKKS